MIATRALATLICFSVFGLNVRAQQGETPTELVRQLGDRSFPVRQRATERLLALAHHRPVEGRGGYRGIEGLHGPDSDRSHY